ncbi:Piwi domain-containing protein [Pisolithus marmoratus]|nr:Piwi domain-containing protein [Pisolithus marmoratus]
MSTAPDLGRGNTLLSHPSRVRGGGQPISSQPPSAPPSSASAQSPTASTRPSVSSWSRGQPAWTKTTGQPFINPQPRGGGPPPISSRGGVSLSFVCDADGPPLTVEGLPSVHTSSSIVTSLPQRDHPSDAPPTEFPRGGPPFLPTPSPRPGVGKAGLPVKVLANFFRVNFQGKRIYEYTVGISPSPSPSRKAELFNLLERSQAQVWREFYPFIVHDKHAKLYSVRELPQPLVIEVTEKVGPPPSHESTFTFSIEKNCELNTDALSKYLKGDLAYQNYNTSPVIAVYNLMLQKYASSTAMRVSGGDEVRSGCYYFKNTEYRSGLLSHLQPQRSLSDRLQAWGGVFVSVRPVHSQLMVNVGLCVSAFHKSRNLGEAISVFKRASHGADPTRFLQGVKVTSEYRGYMTTMRVQEVVDKPPAKLRFQWDNKDVSVADYIERRYNTSLKHAGDWPVINVAGRKSPHPVYVPVELCRIAEDQLFKGKLEDNEAREMIKFACRKPADNRILIDEGLRLLGFSKPNTTGMRQSALTDAKTDNATLDNFDITVDPRMVDILARVLPCPKLQYGNRRLDNVKDGGWNTLGCKFVRGAVVQSWCVLNVRDGALRPNNDDLTPESICKEFEKKCKECGIMFKGKPAILKTEALPDIQRDACRRKALAEVRRVIKDWCDANFKHGNENRAKSSFILVLLRRRDNFIYPGIKRMCDLEFGIHTLHVLVSKLDSSTPSKLDQYYANVALKVNIKLGGVNHLLGDDDVRWLKQKKTMVVGMDVTHPSPGSHVGTPSIAAVVASVDNSFVHFPASLRCQISKQEMIGDLRAMFNKRLHAYGGRPETLPERVIVYRDGVSEALTPSTWQTQYNAVLMDELQSIKDAFTDKYGSSPHPALTIVVCGKRHHVRLFPAHEQTSNATGVRNRSGNTLPGTVVDNTITSVFYFDFYLQAHAAVQGHVKGTHYVVLYDENNLGSDEVQQGTYSASYLYARASKSVSLVPPAYYADLACERGRCYLNNFFDGNELDDNRKESTSGGKAREDDGRLVFNKALKAWGEGVHKKLKDSMFYI